jgi:hypothetical protein
MPKVSASAEIPVRIEEAFGFLADYRNIPLLQAQFTSARLISKQENGVGATVELRGRFRGMPMHVHNRIVTYAPPRRLVSISEGTVLSRNAWELEEIRANPALSRVSLTVEYKVAGPLSRVFTGLASSLFHSEIQAMTEESLRRLRQILTQENPLSGIENGPTF